MLSFIAEHSNVEVNLQYNMSFPSTKNNMFCQVHLHFSVPINFQPTQQNARARRSSYASADNDGTSYLHNLISELLEVPASHSIVVLFL
jgi:hypothetical protein